MPVDTYAANALFRITTIKHHAGNPDNAWANTYEFKAMASGTAGNLVTLAGKLADFEEDFHFDSTVFDRAIVSTWEPDSAPYNPLNFLTVSIGTTGEPTAATNALGLSTVLHVVRNPAFGRLGHLFYRNCLAEADISAPSGKNVLSDLAGTNAAIAAAEIASGIDDHYGAAPEEDLVMVMIDAAGVVVRPVINLVVTGVTQVKTDHKWYNRTVGP